MKIQMIGMTICLAAMVGCSGGDLDARWGEVTASGVCMPGGMMWSDQELSGDARHDEVYKSVVEFNELPAERTVPFLLSLLDSQEETEVHICPFQVASEGELAVYVLTIITGKPWAISLQLPDETINHQAALRSALADDAKRRQLADYYSLNNTGQ